MVRHVAVRNKCKAIVGRGALNLLTYNLDSIEVNERIVTVIRAKCQEVRMWAQVVEQFQTFWSSRQHPRRKASDAPEGPAKAGHYGV